tara:strand:- start:1198 stop:2355 length:1158 start_codon:yes stop_codon:yes gene_type:complete
MAKINVRSPYFVNVFHADLASAKLDIEIYAGTAHSLGHTITPTYTLSSSSVGQFGFYVNFEISNLIKDYIATGFDGNYAGTQSIANTINVDYQVTRTLTNGTSTALTAVLGVKAFDGYGYFEDGANPELLQGLLISNKIIIKPDDSPLRIPVDANNTTSVSFFYNNQEIYTQAVASQTDSKDYIQYISNETQSGADSYEDRVLQDGGTFENSQCLNNFLAQNGIYGVDEVYVDGVEGVTRLEVRNIDECKHTPYKMVFVNKYGALQDLWMFKRSNLSMKKDEESFRSSTLLSATGTYNTFDHQYKTFNINAKETLTLNTGFYPEEYNEIFRQFTLSELVWIEYDNKTLPVTVKSSDLSFQTQLNDKLINYTIQVEFAFDKINSVR